MPLSFITSLVEIEVGEQSHSGCWVQLGIQMRGSEELIWDSLPDDWVRKNIPQKTQLYLNC